MHPATWYVIKGSADIRWRAELPVRHLKAKLITMRHKDTRALTTPNTDMKFQWSQTATGAQYPEHEGVAVWTRPCMVRATHAAAMSMNGIRTLAEVDDNYLSNPSQNIFMKLGNYTRTMRKSHMQSLASFDGIIFSTEWLRDEYDHTFRKELGLKHEDLFVCRNHVDPDDWEKRVDLLPPKDRVRVGWMGSHQHVVDLRLAAPALRLAQDMGCEVVLVGLDPAIHDPKWRDFLGPYTHIPWFTPRLYHRSRLNFDIGLIPLVYNKHTMGKSDVKFLEYAMSGVATVAWSHPIYNKTVIHGETGLLASSPDDMALKMAELIKNARPRQELAVAARQWVLENRTMQRQGLPEWQAALAG